MAAKSVKLADSLIEALAKATSKGEQQTIIKNAGLSQNEGKAAIKEADKIKLAVPVGTPKTPGEDFNTSNPKEWDMMSPQQQKDYTQTGKMPPEVTRAYEDAATGSGLNLPAVQGVTPSIYEPPTPSKGITDLVTTGQPVLEQAKVNRYNEPDKKSEAANSIKKAFGGAAATAAAVPLMAGSTTDPEDVPASIPDSGIRLPSDLNTGIKAGQDASSVSKVAQAPEPPAPTPTPIAPPSPATKTETATTTIQGPYKPGSQDAKKWEKKYQELDTNFNTRIDGIKQLASESEGYEKEKYEKLGASLDKVRDRIDAFDSNERKMLAWERVGDMLARSLGQLGAGLAGVSKPLELQAADQSARYADLQALGKQQRDSLGQERALGEKSYSERMRDIGKQAAEMRNEEERKYSVGSQGLSRQQASEQRSIDSMNDFMSKTQAFQERQSERQTYADDKKTETMRKNIVTQLGAQYSDKDKQISSVDRELGALAQLDKALANPKTLKGEVTRIKAEFPDESAWFGGSTLDTPEAIQEIKKGLESKKSSANARKNQFLSEKNSLLKQGEQVSVMNPEELNSYASEVKKKGKPTEGTSQTVGQGEVNKTVVKAEKNNKTGQVRYTYSDGTTEIK